MVVLFIFTMRVEDGNLFDSSYEDVNKAYGTFDENRAAQNGYQAFPFQAGKKDGMIRIFGRIKSDVLWGQSGLIHSF
jgi:FKBP-type peptidyl-prolyl cis-trans isomerase 2